MWVIGLKIVKDSCPFSPSIETCTSWKWNWELQLSYTTQDCRSWTFSTDYEKEKEKKPEGIITTTRTNTSPRMVSHLELYDYYFFPFQTWSHLTFLQFDYFQPKMVMTLHCTCRLHSTLLWRRKSLIKFINLQKTPPIFRQNYNLLNVLSCEISGFNNYGKCAQVTR